MGNITSSRLAPAISDDIILACDTSQQACSVALALPSGEVREDYREIKQPRVSGGHAEILPNMIKALLDETLFKGARLSVADIDRFGVTLGPGTFAGVRVGLSAMRALSLAARDMAQQEGGKGQVYGVNALQVMAAGVDAKDNPRNLPIGVVVDAKRGQLYAQVFNAPESETAPPETLPEASSEARPKAMTPAEFLAAHGACEMILLGTGIAVFEAGEGSSNCPPLNCPPLNWKPITTPLFPRARDILPLVAAMPIKSSYTGAPDPLYIRPPDAALPKTNQRLKRK